MLNAANLLLVAFSKMYHAAGVAQNPMAGIDGQLFVFFIMVVAAAEVSVGLAIIVMLYPQYPFGGYKFFKPVKALKHNNQWLSVYEEYFSIGLVGSFTPFRRIPA